MKEKTDAPEVHLAPAEEGHVDEIPDLVFSTGRAVYGYIFGSDRKFFDVFIRRSWMDANSLHSMADTTVALSGDELMGIELGYSGDRYYELRKSSGSVSKAMLASNDTTPEDLQGIANRSYKNDFQIPRVPNNAYYIMALAVKEDSRGLGLGAKLLNNAIDRARKEGCRTLHLDVLSDNPAVDFYKRMGLTCMAETSVPELGQHHGVPAEYRMVLDLEN
jgi:ribosomal protein S18 acetylase RimI-like enzyme